MSIGYGAGFLAFLLPRATNIYEHKSSITFIILNFVNMERFVLEYQPDDFKPANDGQGYSLEISANTHQKGKNPIVNVFIEENGGYIPIGTGLKHDQDGNITIVLSKNKYSGRVVIL